MNIQANWSIHPIQLQDNLLIEKIRTDPTQSLIRVHISSLYQKDIQLTSHHRSTIPTATIILIMLHQSNQQYTVMLKRTLTTIV